MKRRGQAPAASGAGDTASAAVVADGTGSRRSRRGFLGALWSFVVGAALLELGWVIASFVRPRRASEANRHEDALIVAGPAEAFDAGSVTAFPRGKFYLVRLDDGGFLAVHRECTHLGCTVPWIETEQRFACPCHASCFDRTGAVLSPPAPRPLDLLPIRIENGVVKVEVGRPVRRESFSADQVEYL